LALAKTALDELALERVLLVPARLAPQKSAAEDPGGEHRLRMCQLAFGAQPHLEVSTLELERPGPSYTVDTLRSIKAANPHKRLTLIAGADTAQSLPSWSEPADVLRLAELAVAERDDLAREAVESAVRSVEEAAGLSFLAMPPLGISSSQVRTRVAAGQPIEELVGVAVAGYIRAHALYRTAVAA
jgi:nicotinate-nucleotide adenylyltransferase